MKFFIPIRLKEHFKFLSKFHSLNDCVDAAFHRKTTRRGKHQCTRSTRILSSFPSTWHFDCNFTDYLLNSFNVIRWKHTTISSPLHSSRHPAFIDRYTSSYYVTWEEREEKQANNRDMLRRSFKIKSEWHEHASVILGKGERRERERVANEHCTRWWYNKLYATRGDWKDQISCASWNNISTRAAVINMKNCFGFPILIVLFLSRASVEESKREKYIKFNYHRGSSLHLHLELNNRRSHERRTDVTDLIQSALQ